MGGKQSQSDQSQSFCALGQEHSTLWMAYVVARRTEPSLAAHCAQALGRNVEAVCAVIDANWPPFGRVLSPRFRHSANTELALLDDDWQSAALELEDCHRSISTGLSYLKPEWDWAGLWGNYRRAMLEYRLHQEAQQEADCLACARALGVAMDKR
jgi:hypothetical protein